MLRFSIKDWLWIVLVGAAATGWSIDHYLATSKHNAAAGEIARLAPIEAAQLQKVRELRTKLFDEKAKRRGGTGGIGSVYHDPQPVRIAN